MAQESVFAWRRQARTQTKNPFNPATSQEPLSSAAEKEEEKKRESQDFYIYDRLRNATFLFALQGEKNRAVKGKIEGKEGLNFEIDFCTQKKLFLKKLAFIIKLNMSPKFYIPATIWWGQY